MLFYEVEQMINHNREVILFGLPPATKEVPGMWYKGYPIHKGLTESSMNFASLYAHEKNIIPDQEELKKEWLNFVYNLTIAGFRLNILPFPAEISLPLRKSLRQIEACATFYSKRHK